MEWTSASEAAIQTLQKTTGELEDAGFQAQFSQKVASPPDHIVHESNQKIVHTFL